MLIRMDGFGYLAKRTKYEQQLQNLRHLWHRLCHGGRNRLQMPKSPGARRGTQWVT
jgi:hypothetical protein